MSEWDDVKAVYLGAARSQAKSDALCRLHSAIQGLVDARVSAKPRVIKSAERFLTQCERTADDAVNGRFNEENITIAARARYEQTLGSVSVTTDDTQFRQPLPSLH